MRPWSIQCLIDWLRIRESEGKSFPTSIQDLSDQIDHSALLERLMLGKGHLNEPPPLSFSRPWYQLIDEGTITADEVYFGDQFIRQVFGGDTIMINQAPWRIVESIDENTYIISYGNSLSKFKLYRLYNLNKPIWKIDCIQDLEKPRTVTKRGYGRT